MKVALIVLFIFTGLIELLAIERSITPRSDQELARSFVDTWVPSAFLTELILVAMLVILTSAVVLLFRLPQSRGPAICLILLTVVTATHWIINHAVLTIRAEKVWDLEIRGFYGIFDYF